MTDGPDISVVIPFYDREQYLAEAIDSVMTQDVDVELVLVDDGSTDASASIAAGYRDAQLIRRPHAGYTRAVNTGIDAAHAPLVAFCDSDDVWLPGKLRLQLAALEADARIGFCFTHLEEFLSPEIDPATAKTRSPRGTLPGSCPTTLLARRTALDSVGPFDESLDAGGWVEWYARARELGIAQTMLPDVLARRRLHHANNFTRADPSRGHLAVARRWVHQRREQR